MEDANTRITKAREDKVIRSLFLVKNDQTPNSSCQDSKEFAGP